MVLETDNFVWNVTFLTGFLTIGFSFGMVFGLLMPNNPLGIAGRLFVHLDVGHIVMNLLAILLYGVSLSGFAHPVEFGGILLSTIPAHIAFTLVWFDVSGLSFAIYAVAGALIVYLFAVLFEIRHASRGKQLVVLLAALLLLGIVYMMESGQLRHDVAVVFQNQPIQYDWDGYTQDTSRAHIAGFCWGLVAAIGLRIVRYRFPSIERVADIYPSGNR